MPAQQKPSQQTQSNLAEYLPDDARCLGVLSGKGGVGKSLVAGLLAVAFARSGHAAGILDADLTGPSIPRMFGVKRPSQEADGRLVPSVSDQLSIRIMSLNLLMEHEDDPVVWRGPLISKTVEQFITEVDWTGVRYLFIDLPPGTSDVPLTVMQRVPLNGLVVVSSPQELVGVIVRKAIRMAGLLKVPVIGLVENMTHMICPECGAEIRVFGSDREERAAGVSGVPKLTDIPLDPELARLCDSGGLESYERNPFDGLVDSIAASMERREAKA